MSKIINKFNILALVIAIIIVIMLGMVLFGNSEVSVEEKVRVNLFKIDESINKAINENTELALSSNPYDYIKDNEYYKNIIELGVAALPELDKSLSNSDVNSLNEYILVIAIEEITHTNVNGILEKEYSWENAKDFLYEWTDIKENVNNEVSEIVTSSKLTAIEKSKKLENYGVLAVPTIKDINKTNAIYSFEKEISDLVSSYDLTESDLAILSDYLK